MKKLVNSIKGKTELPNIKQRSGSTTGRRADTRNRATPQKRAAPVARLRVLVPQVCAWLHTHPDVGTEHEAKIWVKTLEPHVCINNLRTDLHYIVCVFPCSYNHILNLLICVLVNVRGYVNSQLYSCLNEYFSIGMHVDKPGVEYSVTDYLMRIYCAENYYIHISKLLHICNIHT